MQTLQDPILQLSWVCTRLSNPKSGVDLSFINDLFNKIASNNQHAHNGLLQSVKVPLPLLPAGCFAAAGIYLFIIGISLSCKGTLLFQTLFRSGSPGLPRRRRLSGPTALR